MCACTVNRYCQLRSAGHLLGQRVSFIRLVRVVFSFFFTRVFDAHFSSVAYSNPNRALRLYHDFRSVLGAPEAYADPHYPPYPWNHIHNDLLATAERGQIQGGLQ